MPQADNLDEMDGNRVQGRRRVVRENKDIRWEITESVFCWKTESSRRRLSTCSVEVFFLQTTRALTFQSSVTKIKAEVLSRQRENNMEFIKNKRQWVSKPVTKATMEKRIIIIIIKSCSEDQWLSSYGWPIKGKLCCRYINTARGNVAAHE